MKAKGKYVLATLISLSGLGFLLLTNSGLLSTQQPYIRRHGPDLYPDRGDVAIVHVNVIPMDREEVLADWTVVVGDGLIAQVGPATEVEIPADALVVEGQGAYLMPGLVDMHVHIKEENELLLFVAHGVTAVRDMWGTTGMQLRLGFPDQLALRAQVATGELLGPTIYTAGPLMEGAPATSPLMPVIGTVEEAAASVVWQREQGYDFIKVYDNLSPEVYEAILRTAREQGFPVVGHAPKQAGLDRVLAGGQRTIEHLTGYIDPDAADFAIPKDRLAEFAVRTREAGVWNTPTIGVYQMHVSAEQLSDLEHRPEMAYISPRMKTLWKRMLRPGAMQNISYQGDYPARINEIYTEMTRILHENGAGIVLGTDADNPYLVPGVSLLDELDYLIAAGFTPYEALRTGTYNAAVAMDRLDEFGTVEVGKRADLILLAANPLDDIAHVRQRLGVMVRGAWLPESRLQEILSALIASYVSSRFDRLWPLGLLVAGSAFLMVRNSG